MHAYAASASVKSLPPCAGAPVGGEGGGAAFAFCAPALLPPHASAPIEAETTMEPVERIMSRRFMSGILCGLRPGSAASRRVIVNFDIVASAGVESPIEELTHDHAH